MIYKLKQLIIILVIIMLSCTIYMFYPRRIKLELISQYNSDSEQYEYSSYHWKIIYDESDSFLENLKKQGIMIPNVDFNNNNMIISIGREIYDITYCKAKKISGIKNTPYVGKANYGDAQTGVIYFYKIKKVNIAYNVFEDII